MTLRWSNICIDSTDPAPLARWWADALSWRITHEGDDEVVLEPPAGSKEDGVSPDILFLKVPEGKTLKNRVHIDLRPEHRDAEVARLETLGGKRIDIGQGDVTWVVMADPQGNEFCVLRALRPDELAGA
ncbi:MAG: VOC family protein [Dehalococcoidia bacterium]